MKPMYKRVLLKLSGEALAGDKGFGINRLSDLKFEVSRKKTLSASCFVRKI